MDALLQDLHYAWRSLRRAPSLVAVALVSLTLGIGANSTIFSLVSAVQFRPLPYRDANRLVDLHEDNLQELCAGCGVGTSYATFVDWRNRTSSFDGMGAFVEDAFALAGSELPERASGAYVSADLFPLLGVQPILGRHFTSDEDRPGGSPVVLLGYELWQTRFNGDSALVGRAVRVNGVPHTVVGIMPPRFRFPEFARLWLPIAPTAASRPRDDRSVGVIARLREGVSITQADADIAAVMSGVAAEHPEALTGWTARATLLRDDLTRDSAPPFLLLLGAAGFVLLIACANLANLLLVRALDRERDFALRIALGASRRQLARQLLTESLMLSLAGGAAGLLVALWGTEAVVGLIPSDIPFWIEVAVDWRVVLFTVGLSVATGLAFGSWPAWRAGRTVIHEVLKAGARTASPPRARGRARSALVVGEIALALVLLAGTGLMVRTYLRVSRTDDLGYDPRNVLRGSVELRTTRYADEAQMVAFGSTVVERLEATAGVEHAALESVRFLGTFVGDASAMTLEGASAPVPDEVVPRFAYSVTPEWFDVMRVPLVRGRSYTAADGQGAPGVAIVNEAAAGRLWPGEDALGKRFRLGSDDEAAWFTVVGVVRSTMGSPLAQRRGPAPYVYVPFAQQPGTSVTVLVRSIVPPTSLAPQVRSVVAAADPDLPLTDVRTMEAFLADWVRPVTFFVRTMGALSLLAVAIAAVGLYGVMAYAVAQRTHEIGVRVALGATGVRIVRLLVAHGLRLGLMGALLGITGALLLTGVLRQILFGTSPTDPVVFTVVTAVLLGVVLIASLIPARRALRVNPVEALRAE